MIHRLDQQSGAPEVPTQCAAIVCAPYVFTSGIRARSAGPDVTSQMTEILAKIESLLERSGSDVEHILRAEITLADMADFDAMNSVWNAWVDSVAPPGRACLSASLCERGSLVQVSVIAVEKRIGGESPQQS